MARVVVPVRFPLTERSCRTLDHAIAVADERDADLIVLHVNLYQSGNSVTRAELKRAVQREFGILSRARYVVRSGFLVEESILNEVAEERADVVVIGQRQAGRWRRMMRKILDDPDIERFLREKLECEIITVS